MSNKTKRGCNYHDLVGKRFGKLVVKKDVGRYSQGDVKWLCECDCGRTTTTKYSYLKKGKKCCYRCMNSDFLNKKIGHVTVIGVELGKRNGLGYKKISWKCICDCGEICYLRSCDLKSGYCSCKQCKQKIKNKKYEEILGSYWSRLIQHAKNRHNDFSITMQYVYSLYLKQHKRCAISGIELIFAKNKKEHIRGLQTASLDRIDSSKGYIVGNVQWVHKDINKMKLNHTDEQFIEYCRIVTKYQDELMKK